MIFDKVLVTKDNNYYECFFTDKWKCGVCLRGDIVPMYPYPYKCLVCNAKFNKAYYREKGVIIEYSQ